MIDEKRCETNSRTRFVARMHSHYGKETIRSPRRVRFLTICSRELFYGFSLTRFDGSTMTI